MSDTYTIIENRCLDEERALYASHHAEIVNCRFEGPADGESALKESKDIRVRDCSFFLRYPFWHNDCVEIASTYMAETCRAALWYSTGITIRRGDFHGIKVLRECRDVDIAESVVESVECGWFCHNVKVSRSRMCGEYLFFQSGGLNIDHLQMQGKYSFQYVQGGEIRDSYLDTKDAFWHSKNMTVVNSVVKGEYLGWYSDNLRLVNCKIIGTQPLCYATNLTLENCEMIGTDLSFEYSDVNATVTNVIDSVKNPKSGSIRAKGIGEIIFDDHRIDAGNCQIQLEQG